MNLDVFPSAQFFHKSLRRTIVNYFFKCLVNFSNIWSWGFFLLGDIYPSVSLCIYLPVIRNDKDCTLFGNETLPNNDWRRIIHSMPSLLLGHSETHQLVAFACHSQLFFICAFSCTYFLFQRPPFHILFCQASEAWPESCCSVPGCLLTDIAHLVYLSFPWSQHLIYC